MAIDRGLTIHPIKRLFFLQHFAKKDCLPLKDSIYLTTFFVKIKSCYLRSF